MSSKVGSDKFIRLMLSILIIEDAYYSIYYWDEIRTPFSYYSLYTYNVWDYSSNLLKTWANLSRYTVPLWIIFYSYLEYYPNSFAFQVTQRMKQFCKWSKQSGPLLWIVSLNITFNDCSFCILKVDMSGLEIILSFEIVKVNRRGLYFENLGSLFFYCSFSSKSISYPTKPMLGSMKPRLALTLSVTC